MESLTDQVDFAVALDVVKGRVDPGGFAMQHRKPAPVGLPGKGNDALCNTHKHLKMRPYVYSADENFNKTFTIQQHDKDHDIAFI